MASAGFTTARAAPYAARIAAARVLRQCAREFCANGAAKSLLAAVTCKFCTKTRLKTHNKSAVCARSSARRPINKAKYCLLFDVCFLLRALSRSCEPKARRIACARAIELAQFRVAATSFERRFFLWRSAAAAAASQAIMNAIGEAGECKVCCRCSPLSLIFIRFVSAFSACRVCG